MKLLLRIAALVAALASGASAHATTYQFSYSFASDPWFTTGPTLLTGTFDGVATGNLIDKLSNISVYQNGVAFLGNGNLFSSFQTGNGVSLMAGVASFDGTQNNFNFTNGLTNFFQMAPATPLTGGAMKYTAAVLNWPIASYVNDTDARIAARWSVSAVPEAQTYAMLIGGLGMLALVARRRRSAGPVSRAA